MCVCGGDGVFSLCGLIRGDSEGMVCLALWSG